MLVPGCRGACEGSCEELVKDLGNHRKTVCQDLLQCCLEDTL